MKTHICPIPVKFNRLVLFGEERDNALFPAVRRVARSLAVGPKPREILPPARACMRSHGRARAGGLAPLIGAPHQPSVAVSSSCFNSRSEIKSGGGSEAEAEDGRRGKEDSGTNNCNVDWMSGCVATTAGGGGVLRDLTTGLLTRLPLLPIFWVRRWWRLRCPRASRHLDRTFRHGFGYLPCNHQSSGLK